MAYIEYQKLIHKVNKNCTQHLKMVNSPNEGIEAHLGRPNGRKMRLLVNSASNMAPVNVWRPPVRHTKFPNLISKVRENLSQHQKFVSSPNEVIEDHPWLLGNFLVNFQVITFTHWNACISLNMQDIDIKVYIFEISVKFRVDWYIIWWLLRHFNFRPFFRWPPAPLH